MDFTHTTQGQNTTRVAYNPTSAPFKWWTQSITDRLTQFTNFAYAQPSPIAGNATQTTITDANGHNTIQQLDTSGRMVASTVTKNTTPNPTTLTTTLAWDSDNNVTKLSEPTGAFTSWTYDSNTGYPVTMTDAVQNAATTPGSTTYGYVTYQAGHVAYLTDKVSASGYRHWHHTYDVAGNLLTSTAPNGMTTGTAAYRAVKEAVGNMPGFKFIETAADSGDSEMNIVNDLAEGTSSWGSCLRTGMPDLLQQP